MIGDEVIFCTSKQMDILHLGYIEKIYKDKVTIKEINNPYTRAKVISLNRVARYINPNVYDDLEEQRDNYKWKCEDLEVEVNQLKR